MNQGCSFQEAVNKGLKLFPNVETYATVADACARRFAGNVDTFIRWYHSGEIPDRLDGKFGLSRHDYSIFKELFPGKTETSKTISNPIRESVILRRKNE